MKNKWLIGVSIVVGGVMMATTAIASGVGTNGYNIYKDAFLNTRAATSLTSNALITVSDNGNVLLKTNALVKADHKSNNLSADVNFTSGSQADQVLVYRENNQTITKLADNPVYNILSPQADNPKWSRMKGQQPSPDVTRDMENIMDLIAGNFQNYISVGRSTNGDKQVTMSLSGNQVPPLADAVASLMVRQGTLQASKLQDPACPVQASVINQIPKLVNGVTISDVLLQADIDKDDIIKNQTDNMTITGRDAQGNVHQIVLKIKVSFSNINNTTPDSVDLSGKQVKTIQPKDTPWANHQK